jgi:hypothetical protein
MDSGATDHVTSELEKVTIRDKYHMKINHIFHSVIKTPTHKILLNNILHVPAASKNLLSINRITLDNHAYIEFWLTSSVALANARASFLIFRN